MAAPTVGAVMGDILPYLGVKKNFTEQDPEGRVVTIPDLTGMTAQQVKQTLKELEIVAQLQGEGETVTEQIPGAGQVTTGNTQMLVYFGQKPENTMVEVPDFMGMTRQQASDAAGLLGLNILVTGNDAVSPDVVVTAQSDPKGTMLPAGSTVTLQFTDIKAAA